MSNCQSIEALLSPYVDEELSAADRTRVEEHLASCESCRATVSAFRDADEALAGGRPMRTPAEWARLESRVSDAIDAEVAKDTAAAAAAETDSAPETPPITRRARNWRLGLLGLLSTATVLTLVWQAREGTLFSAKDAETQIAMKETPTLAPEIREQITGLGYLADDSEDDKLDRLRGGLGDAGGPPPGHNPSGIQNAEPRSAPGATPEVSDRLADNAVREELAALGHADDSPSPEPTTASRTAPPRERIEEQPLAAAAPVELADELNESDADPVEAMDVVLEESVDLAMESVANDLAEAESAAGDFVEEAAVEAEAVELEATELARGVAGDPEDDATSRPDADTWGSVKSLMPGGRDESATKDSDRWGDTSSAYRGGPNPAEILRDAHEARDRGENETSARLYRAAAAAATDDDVRRNARFGLVDLKATLARASREEADLREAAVLVREFVEAYGEHTLARGAIQQGLFVWAELTALPGEDCAEARRLIEAWQVGQEMIQKTVYDAVQTIERNCARR